MHPVLKIMHMLNFLDTFSMGITTIVLFPIPAFVKNGHNRARTLVSNNFTALPHTLWAKCPYPYPLPAL